MRQILLTLAMILPATAAQAQVYVNQAALDQLAGISRPFPQIPAPDIAAAVPRPVHHFHKTPPLKAVAVARPEIAPVTPALVPVVARPAPIATPPKPVAPKPLAPVVLNFAPGSTALPADAMAALRPVCEHAATGGLVGIDAYAPGAASDPSAPMRLSLARAFAVRDALTACGIQAGNIVPRADGAGIGDDANIARISVAAP